MTLQQEIKLPSMQTSWREIRNRSNVIIVLQNKLRGASLKSRPQKACWDAFFSQRLKLQGIKIQQRQEHSNDGTSYGCCCRSRAAWQAWPWAEKRSEITFSGDICRKAPGATSLPLPPPLTAVGSWRRWFGPLLLSAVGCDGNKAAPSSGVGVCFAAVRPFERDFQPGGQFAPPECGEIRFVTATLPSSWWCRFCWTDWWAEAQPKCFSRPPAIFSSLSLCVRTAVYMSHIRPDIWFLVSFLRSESTQSANGPVARAFITESSCFWSKSPLHMQQDLSTQFRIQPVLREMWRDSHCRGLKPRFVTLLTQDRNMNSDFWLLKILLVRSFQFNHGSNVDLENVEMCRRYIFCHFLKISTPGISKTYL